VEGGSGWGRTSSDGFALFAMMYSHSWKMSEKSALNDSLSFFALTDVISSREKSNTSSDSSLSTTMLFSHNVSLVCGAARAGRSALRRAARRGTAGRGCGARRRRSAAPSTR